MNANSPILDVALQALAVGICTVPPLEDGSKAPLGRWKEFQNRLPTEDEIRAWYQNGRTGVGAVCGAVSGGLEMLELEGRAVAEGVDRQLRELCQHTGLGPLLDRIIRGYCERTPSGGLHLLYRVADGRPLGNCKLARRPATEGELADSPDEKVKVLVETRGEGGFTILAPSHGRVHPSGEPWTLLSGGLPTIATISANERDELHRLARALDRMPVNEAPPPPPSPGGDVGGRPGDDYNAASDAHDRTLRLVAAHGWQEVYQRGGTVYLRRPGKQHGVSATLGYHTPGQLIVFSTSTVFEDGKGYSPFQVLALLEHAGDFSAAAKTLADEGYGDEPARATVGNQSGKQPTSEPEPRPTLDPEALYGLAGKFVETYAPHTEADPAGLLITFLTTFGCAVGRKAYAVAGDAEHPAKLNILQVGETSRGRKGTAQRNVEKVFRWADPDWAESQIRGGLASGEGLIAAAKDPKEDEPPVDKRILVVEEEFSRVLTVAAKQGSTLSQVIRQAWDRDWLRVMTRKDPLSAKDTHISVVAHITLEELRRDLTTTDMANGFANRFLMVFVRRTKLLPRGGGLPEDQLRPLGDAVWKALQKARTLGPLARTLAAEDLWADIYVEAETEAPGGLVGSITARAVAQTLRLSVAYAALDGAPHVDVKHLQAAWAVWRYCEQSAKFIFGDSLGDPIADVLLRAIRAAADQGLTFTEQSALFHRHESSERLGQARALLESRGLIETERVESGGPPRFVSKAVSLNSQFASPQAGEQDGQPGQPEDPSDLRNKRNKRTNEPDGDPTGLRNSEISEISPCPDCGGALLDGVCQSCGAIL